MDNLIRTFQHIDFASLFVLMLSMIFTLGSFLEIASKRYRRELREKVVAEMPEHKAFFESKEGIGATRRARIATLIVGIALFVAWLFVLRVWL